MQDREHARTHERKKVPRNHRAALQQKTCWRSISAHGSTMSQPVGADCLVLFRRALAGAPYTKSVY